MAGHNSTLDTLAVAKDRLGSTELRRRIWHISPGLLAFLIAAIPQADPMSDTMRVILIAVAALIGGGIYVRFRLIERPGEGEADRIEAVAGYAGSVVGTMLLFPAHVELGVVVLAILAFGDGAATTIGMIVGGPRLGWNQAKSWAGTLAFVLVSGPLAAFLYWHEANPTVPPATALTIGLSAAIAAAIAESLPSRINDNIRVGLAAAGSLIVLQSCLVGW